MFTCLATTQQRQVKSPRDPGTPAVVSLHVNAGHFSTATRRVTSPTWGPPPPCKQALTSPGSQRMCFRSHNKRSGRLRVTSRRVVLHVDNKTKYPWEIRQGSHKNERVNCIVIVWFHHYNIRAREIIACPTHTKLLTKSPSFSLLCLNFSDIRHFFAICRQKKTLSSEIRQEEKD